MNNLLTQPICYLTGKGELSMNIKLLLRVIYAILIIAIYKLAGLDWVIVISLIFIVTDLDSIADLIRQKVKGKCE